MITYAFGTDGVDRYVRVYRKDSPPCEDELAARRRGEPWNEKIKQQLIEKVLLVLSTKLILRIVIFLEEARGVGRKNDGEKET